MDPGHWKELDVVQAGAGWAASHTCPHISEPGLQFPSFQGQDPLVPPLHVPVCSQATSPKMSAVKEGHGPNSLDTYPCTCIVCILMCTYHNSLRDFNSWERNKVGGKEQMTWRSARYKDRAESCEEQKEMGHVWPVKGRYIQRQPGINKTFRGSRQQHGLQEMTTLILCCQPVSGEKRLHWKMWQMLRWSHSPKSSWQPQEQQQHPARTARR